MKKILFFAFLTLLIASCKDKSNDNPNADQTAGKEEVIELSTSFGKMYLWLYKDTPKHRANFLKLTKEGFYDGTTFHRIVRNFVIQGGDPNSKDADPNNDGTGGPGYTIDAEILAKYNHKPGALGAARLADNVNPQRASSGSQFYISLYANSNTKGLDGAYTVFGEMISGLDIARTIEAQPHNTSNGRPSTPIPMTVKVVSFSKDELKSQFGFTIPE